jgi:Fe2+ transport system protein B
MDTLYCVVFKGEIVDGESIDNVKKKLASMFKTDVSSIEKFFTGKAHTVKKDVNLETGEKIKAAFSKAGALCHLKKTEAQKPAPEPKLESKRKAIDVNALKENIAKRVSEASIQMKPGIDEAREKASKTFAKASQSIKADMETGGMQALTKNKYFVGSIAACFVLLIMFFGIFSGGGNPMPLTMENIDRLSDSYDSLMYQMSANQVAKFKNDKKAALEFSVIKPIEDMGYDFEAIILEISDSYLSGDLPMEMSMAAMAVLMVPTQARDLLYDNDVISKSVKKRLDKVAEEMGV